MTMTPPAPPTSPLRPYPPTDRWDDWTEHDPRAWPRRVLRNYMLIPTVCFNCESACGLLAYVDRETLDVQKFEGNPEHPGSRGRNCAKGPATHNQVHDPERILYPLKRAGKRGEGKWVRTTWDEALADIGGRIRKAFEEERHDEVMYHVGRPGHDGLMEYVLWGWGIDGHNSHTNVCSASARAGYAFWTGLDRPSPDHANASVILLISAHLETGHYFNPHAQRIIEGKLNGAKLIVMDTRLSNTASRADHWLSPWPGSEAAILLAIARHIVATGRHDREFVRRWVNWDAWLAHDFPGDERTFEQFERRFLELYAPYTFDFAAAESGVDAAVIARVADIVADAGSRLAAHTWRSATAGNLGGWQVARCLFLLNVLTGSVGTSGGTSMNAWDKWVPRPPLLAPNPPRWNELSWPREYPLTYFELSYLLPHFLKEGRAKLDTYFTRVYNPVWTNPDGATWIEALTDESKVGLHVCLTPTWSETAHFADYVLPMGHASERHDIMSTETHAGCWIAFRQPVRRVALEKMGRPVEFTWQANPGEVWEETEFFIALSWRIDPDGALGIRKHFESPHQPGRMMTVDEYYGWLFDHNVPGLPEKAAAEGLSPLAYMRKYGAFELRRGPGAPYDQPVADDLLAGARVDDDGVVWSPAPAVAGPNITPHPAFPPGLDGRRVVGRVVDDAKGDAAASRSTASASAAGEPASGTVRRGFDTPSRRLEFFSPTLAEWGWPEWALPGYTPSHVHPSQVDAAKGEMVLISTFRLPTLIHTRTGNSKWLYEISHNNPLWLHPADAARLGLKTGDLVRVTTEIGHFIDRLWVTEGIRPGVAACSHHLGRWRLTEEGGGRFSTALVDLTRDGQPVVAVPMAVEASTGDSGGGGGDVDGPRVGQEWAMRRIKGAGPFKSADPDSSRIWWKDVGVHQNLTFPVHPDPVSGMHCWHQKVTIAPARPDDRLGDVHVDTSRSMAVYRTWLALARGADEVSPDGTRRPYWMLRAYRPAREAFRLSSNRPSNTNGASGA